MDSLDWNTPTFPASFFKKLQFKADFWKLFEGQSGTFLVVLSILFLTHSLSDASLFI